MDSRDDLARFLEQRRADPAFAERVRRRMTEDKAILDRLAESERSDDVAHHLALELARHQRVDPPHAHCTCNRDGEEVVRLGELFSKHLVEVVCGAGWVPGELLAAEQARNATLTDTIGRVRAVCDDMDSTDAKFRREGDSPLAIIRDLRAALDGPGEEDG